MLGSKHTMGARPVLMALLALVALKGDDLRAWVTSPREDAAMGYYTAALKGAAQVGGQKSSSFQRLARLHYRAVELRRQHRWDGATQVYRAAIALQEKMPPPKEVPAYAAVACSWLNLALTEKNNQCLENARQTFQKGTQMDKWMHEVEGGVCLGEPGGVLRSHGPITDSHELRSACSWLATLLVAWGLLETKRGFRARAKVLAARAAVLDRSKAKVLSWKIVTG
eukprot:g30101.t1